MIERAYAKINLALEVENKRPDGFHNVKTLMVPIDLYDELEFIEIPSGIELESNIDINDNFVYKAAKLFFDKYNIKDKGIRIKLKKNIPLASGMAGGSSDASACLRGLNKIFGLNRPLDELATLSSILGSDMPYCVYQRPSICEGRGEIVKVLNDLSYKPIPITLLFYDFGLSTKEVYRNYQYLGINKDNNYIKIISGLAQNNIPLINEAIFNDLEDVSLKLEDKLLKSKEIIKDLGYISFQSGSGPTRFILGDADIKIENVRIFKTNILCSVCDL